MRCLANTHLTNLKGESVMGYSGLAATDQRHTAAADSDIVGARE